jgi:uncharacterized DUF497 family protein
MKFDKPDPKKDAATLAARGYTLGQACAIFANEPVIVPANTVNGEAREAAIAFFGEPPRLWVLIFTRRGELIRPISFHPAEGKFERAYYENV